MSTIYRSHHTAATGIFGGKGPKSPTKPACSDCAELVEALKKQIEFHSGLATEAEAVNMDFSRGRAVGIRDLILDINRAIAKHGGGK